MDSVRLAIPLVLLVILGAASSTQFALAAPAAGGRGSPTGGAAGTLTQLKGPAGCLVDRFQRRPGCTRVRALRGPAPFLGSGALAIARDGRYVYVASSRSDAIAVFARSARTGKLRQRRGAAGCIAARDAFGCATARGLNGPNSVAVSADGRSVYATSVVSDSVAVFRRNRTTGALTQLRGESGCVAARAIPG